MATFQDASIGMSVVESSYAASTTPTRWFEFMTETLDWKKKITQGKGLRVGGRVARSGRRVVTTAQGAGDWDMECTSKGMGLLWQACLGTGVSTNVSGATYQQLFTLGDAPGSVTLQKGIPEVGGSVDPITFPGSMVDTWEFDFVNDGIATLKTTWDMGQIATATSYATPSYSTSPTLYHFANGSITTGTLTPPTATVLGGGGTVVADVRGGTLTVSNNLTKNRFNLNGTGRESKPTIGLRTIAGKFDAEYDATTYRDAMLNETPFNLVLTYTGAALSTGVETLQVMVPEIKFDTQLPFTNGTDLITEPMAFQGLDNLSATQPIWVVMRTADTAL